MTYLPQAVYIADAVASRLSEQAGPVGAYWFRIEGDRTECADQLRAITGGSGIVVLPVRGVPFNDPNSILFDLVALLNENERECTQQLSTANVSKHALVLLARNSLEVAQAPSPVQLPLWYPRIGGDTVFMVIEDLTYADVAPLSATESRLGDVAQGLHSLEGALLERMRYVHSRDRQATDPLADLWRRDSDPPFGELLGAMDACHNLIRSPSDFRPSRREGESLVARLWSICGDRNPEELKASKHLARALALDPLGTQPREAMVAVLARASQPLDAHVRTARNLLTTTYAGCQLVTAGAHSDEYGKYSVQLLTALSYDIRLTLDGLRAHLHVPLSGVG